MPSKVKKRWSVEEGMVKWRRSADLGNRHEVVPLPLPRRTCSSYLTAIASGAVDGPVSPFSRSYSPLNILGLRKRHAQLRGTAKKLLRSKVNRASILKAESKQPFALAGKVKKQTPVGQVVRGQQLRPNLEAPGTGGAQGRPVLLREPFKASGAAEARGCAWPHWAPSDELRGHGRGRRRVRAEPPSAAGARPGRGLRG